MASFQSVRTLLLVCCVSVGTSTYRAAVLESLDVRAGLEGKLLFVGALEAQCPLVLVLVFGSAVGPGHGAVAVVGKVLAGLDAQ